MKDIENNDDLYVLVDAFYKKLLSDSSISYIFTEVVKIKLEEHLPILVTFWSQSLFNTGGYFKNLTNIHLDINAKEYLSPELFIIWLNHQRSSHWERNRWCVKTVIHQPFCNIRYFNSFFFE